MAAARSVFRSASTSLRASASRISGSSKASAARSPFCIRTQKPLSHRIFRSPVEMSSFGLLPPFHTATASALMTSKLSTAPCRFGWLIDDS